MAHNPRRGIVSSCISEVSTVLIQPLALGKVDWLDYSPFLPVSRTVCAVEPLGCIECACILVNAAYGVLRLMLI